LLIRGRKSESIVKHTEKGGRDVLLDKKKERRKQKKEENKVPAKDYYSGRGGVKERKAFWQVKCYIRSKRQGEKGAKVLIAISKPGRQSISKRIKEPRGEFIVNPLGDRCEE